VYLFKKPSNERDWSPDQVVLPYADLHGSQVHLHNIRNCAYKTTRDYLVRHYDKTFDLDRIESVFYVIEPFARWFGMAHTFLSFGFAGPEYIAVSVEIRKRQGQIFSPLKGLLRQYEIMYVIGDENDLIKLRTNYRRSPVYLYPARAAQEKVRDLFLSMMDRANQLRARPEFYNTLTNTCTTNIVRHINRIAPQRIPRSRQILFPSLSDRLAYDLGLIDSDLSFAQARVRYHINDRAARFADDPEFSVRIREVDRPGTGS
jgi:hypothetical protein